MMAVFATIRANPLFAAQAVQIEAQKKSGAAFVDNQTCGVCHVQYVEDWRGSHHEQSMQEANQQSVLGDFNNVSFTDAGLTSRFFQKKGKFFINTQGADGQYADFEVKYTFGVTPLQQYLLALPNGRLQSYTVAWDSKEKRWFDLYPDEKMEPDDPLHWTGRLFTANSSCIECHTTNMVLNYDVKSATYDTTWDGINVNCQSCHGPGDRHLKWATEGGGKEDTNKGLVVDYNGLDSKGEVETCARCHARRYAVSENDGYGHSFYDDFMPALLHEGLYHVDGQVIDEVYVYGSFIQSKMYHKGVSCTNCHDPHTLKLRQQGNPLCVTCHQSNPPAQKFSTLKKKNYNTSEHHFHDANSVGAQCINCHMPKKTFMKVDPRHDHSFPIPRPDLSVNWGTPNACSGCHADQSNEWAAKKMDTWYGKQWRNRPNITRLMSDARARVPRAEIPLSQLIKDLNQPAIVRATALDLLSSYGAKGGGSIISALTDESPLVRAAAVRNLEKLSDSKKLDVLLPLLSDPIRGVRIEVARVMARMPKKRFNQQQWKIFEGVLEEYKIAQMALADHPEGHLNLGNLYTNMGKPKLAEKSYLTAIKIGPRFLPAHNSLANFYYHSKRKKEAEKTFRQALQLMPKQGVLYYSLGLLLTEQQRLDEAIILFAKAAELMPDNHRIYYNYGLLLQKFGKIPQAEKVLLQAYELSTTDQNTLMALISLYREQGALDKALPYIKKLKDI